jgi:hypothetical protein
MVARCAGQGGAVASCHSRSESEGAFRPALLTDKRRNGRPWRNGVVLPPEADFTASGLPDAPEATKNAPGMVDMLKSSRESVWPSGGL